MMDIQRRAILIWDSWWSDGIGFADSGRMAT